MLIVMSFQVNFGPLDVQKISAQVGLLNFKHRGLLFIPHHSALFLGPYLLPNGLNFFRRPFPFRTFSFLSSFPCLQPTCFFYFILCLFQLLWTWMFFCLVIPTVNGIKPLVIPNRQWTYCQIHLMHETRIIGIKLKSTRRCLARCFGDCEESGIKLIRDDICEQLVIKMLEVSGMIRLLLGDDVDNLHIEMDLQ